MKKDFLKKDRQNHIPKPIYEAHPEYEQLYTKAWELAEAHIRSIDGMPQSPYMDEAFCDTQIWIWDTCFMAQFCKLAAEVFPGVESLSNFYEVLYGEKSLPKIVPGPKEPRWTFATPGKENDIYIHIADNPPLFAWVEYENAKWSGDLSRIRELLLEKKYLQKHYEWFENLSEHTKPRGVFNETRLIAEDIGYRWEGGRSGMDNTPRGRRTVGEPVERPANEDMLWVDAICQQALAAKSIASLFELIGEKDASAEWQMKFEEKKSTVNKYYWDDGDKFYYDTDIKTHELCKVKTPASYWALTAGIASAEQARELVKLISDPEVFGGDVPLISLARNDGDYDPTGKYWRGGLWLPTAYAALRGIADYGYLKEARGAAEKIFRHQLRTYLEYEPHTIWECYSPEEPKPATEASGKGRVRPDFCGWSALGPIAMYVEFILGFHSVNATECKVKWAKPENAKGEIGIKNLRFGDTVTDIVANGNACRVISNLPYALEINGKEYGIKSGENNLTLID